MRVVEACAGCRTLIFKNENIAETAVTPQVAVTVCIGANYTGYLFNTVVVKAIFMPWRLYDHFVGANAIHHIVNADSSAVQVSFDLQSRKLVRDNSNFPAGLIG
jgi:hypothetical protein